MLNLHGELSPDATVLRLVVASLISWCLAAALAFFLLISTRGILARRARDAAEMRRLLDEPLEAIQPTQSF